MKIVDITNQRFGRLVAIKRMGSNGHSSIWLCVCDCGNTKLVTLSHLRQGTKSCGCLSEEVAPERGRRSKLGERTRKHGGTGTKLYGVWRAMIRRCENANTLYYDDYGGRGILVCEEWRNDFAKFRTWAETHGYTEGLTIDRIDPNGNYEPSNCRWVTMLEQQNNRRNSIKIEHDGKLYSLREIAELGGLKVRTVVGRYERGDRDFLTLIRKVK